MTASRPTCSPLVPGRHKVVLEYRCHHKRDGSIMDASDSKLQSAQALQLRGRVAEAEALYREVLRERPDTALALEGLGVLVFQQGRAAEAAELFARGVAILPESARFHANLGEALRSTDRPDAGPAASSPRDRARRHTPPCLEQPGTTGLFRRSVCRLRGFVSRGDQALAAAHRGLHQPGERPLGPGPSGRGRRGAARGLRIEPHNPLTLMNLAWSLCELNDSGCPRRGRRALPASGRSGTAGSHRPQDPRQHSPARRAAR